MLVVLFFLLVITLIVFVVGVITKKKFYRKIILFFWSGVFLLYLALYTIGAIYSIKVLEKEDYYGQYIIDRNYFAGKQADWQYNNFRFVIKENDSIYFYITEAPKIIETYKGVISTVSPYESARLVINMEQPTSHVLESNPTTYREIWNFYLVFHSSKFHNMYFKKGEWNEI